MGRPACAVPRILLYDRQTNIDNRVHSAGPRIIVVPSVYFDIPEATGCTYRSEHVTKLSLSNCIHQGTIGNAYYYPDALTEAFSNWWLAFLIRCAH